MATFPTVTVETAFSTAPFAVTPTYTDLSSYAQAFKTSRGRPNPLTRIEAGSGSVTLDNRDLRFDPLNAGGSYYPNVLPTRKTRISAVYNATTYYLFTGYVQRWPQAWRPPGYTEVELELRDASSLLALADLPADTYPAELAGARVGRVLDAVGFPAADRVLDVGVATIVGATIAADSGTKALSHIQDVADSDLGYVFLDGQGRAVFHDRHHRYDAASDYTALATFGDGGGAELQWDEVEPDYDVERILNDWRVTPSGGSALTIQDATSIAAYGPRTQTRAPLVASVADCQAMGEYLLATTKDPVLRFDRLVIRPTHVADGTLRDSLFAQALGRELGDRITVKVRPPGGAYTISQDVWIEGISHDVKGSTDWTTTFLLSPVDPTLASGAGYWILGDSTYGVLGTSTRLAP